MPGGRAAGLGIGFTGAVQAANPEETPDLAAGMTSYPRIFGIATQTGPASQVLNLTFFTASRSMTVSTLAVITGGAAAAATPSKIRYGLYLEAANRDISLVASTAHDATLLTSINTKYPKALSASYDVIAGVRYAVGCLVVSAGTMPDYMGWPLGAATVVNTEHDTAPRLCSRVAAQADLPASLTNATLASNTARVLQYATLT